MKKENVTTIKEVIIDFSVGKGLFHALNTSILILKEENLPGLLASEIR